MNIKYIYVHFFYGILDYYFLKFGDKPAWSEYKYFFNLSIGGVNRGANYRNIMNGIWNALTVCQ